MGLFQKKKIENKIIAQQTGKIVALSQIPDPVFSDKVLGDGIGIVPTENQVLAPIAGTVVQIADTMHAICLESDDGLELLIHLGLETVKLKGKGFTCYVKTGQHVSAGEKLMEMDIEQIQKEGLLPVSPCVITNMDRVEVLKVFNGNTTAGKTVVMEFKLKN